MIDLWAILIALGLFLGSAAILAITEPGER